MYQNDCTYFTLHIYEAVPYIERFFDQKGKKSCLRKTQKEKKCIKANFMTRKHI